MRNTVQFSKGVINLAQNPETIFIEVGPNTHLSGLVRQNDTIKNKSYIINSLGKADSTNEQIKFYKSLGTLWLKGVNADFMKFFDQKAPGFTSLPEYPFDRKRYWIDHFPGNEIVSASGQTITSNVNEEHSEINQSHSFKDSVKSLLSELSGYQLQEINDEQNFSDFGFDSLFLARYAGALGDKFKFNVEFRKLVFEYPNINLLSDYIEKNSPLNNKTVEHKEIPSLKTYLRNFTPFQKEGNLEPLTIVHGDDLNIHLPKYLGKERPYFGFLHPSADGDRLTFSNVQDMAAHYLEQLLVYKPKGPYLLGGFSYGGLLAYEMALQLEKLGHHVPYLFLMDCGTPEARIRHDNAKAKEVTSHIPKFAQEIIYLIRKYYFKVYYKSIRTIRDLYFLSHKKLPIEYRRSYVYDVYTTLSRKYRPSGHFNGKVVIFRASENMSELKYLGWEKLIANICELVTVRGDHVTVLKYEDSIELIQNKIGEYLSKYEEEIKVSK